MNLSTLPDLRAADAPDAPAVADDSTDLNNTQFRHAVRRASAVMDEQRCVRRGRGRDHVAEPGQLHRGAVRGVAPWRHGHPDQPDVDARRGGLPDRRRRRESPNRGHGGRDRRTGGDAVDGRSGVRAAAVTPRTRGAQRRRARPADLHERHHRPPEGRHARPRQPECHVPHGRSTHSRWQARITACSSCRCSTRMASWSARCRRCWRAAALPVAGRFSPKTFFDRLEQSGATYFSAVPTMYTMLADLPADVRPDTSAVRFAICGAAPASVELLTKFETRYGIPLIEGYGLSEGSCASTAQPA